MHTITVKSADGVCSVRLLTRKCSHCGKLVMGGHNCLRERINLPGKYEFTIGYNGSCLYCGAQHDECMVMHIDRFPECVAG